MMRAILAASLVVFAISLNDVQAQDLGKALGVLKGVQKELGLPANQANAGAATPAPVNNQGATAPSTRIAPDWLLAYPRAQLRKEALDPLQRTTVPLSMPTSVGATTSRYMVNMEGKVTFLQYRHEANESPLLIQRHYDAVLAQAGFERVIVCAEACPNNSGGAARWVAAIDRNKAIDYFYFPDTPTILVGYKADAVIFIAIGKNANFPIATTIKLVEGKFIDRNELQVWLDTLKPVAVPAPTTPAIVAPQGLPGIQAASGFRAFESAEVDVVAPNRLSNAIQQTKGKLVVFLSSRDTNCLYCVRANPRYAELAKSSPDAARYTAVFWEPWASAFKTEPLLSTDIRGLPAYLVYEDGELVNRVNGDDQQTPLKVQLFDRRNPTGAVNK